MNNISLLGTKFTKFENSKDSYYDDETALSKKTIKHSPDNIYFSNSKKTINSSRFSNSNKYFSTYSDTKPLCRKLDFFSIDTDEDTNSNYNVNENDLLCIDEEEKNDNSDIENVFKSSFLQKKNRNFGNLEKNICNFGILTQKFDEDYIIIKTLCKGEMGTVFLCLKFLDKKIYVVKKTNFFSRKFDYFKMQSLSSALNSNINDPCAIFIQKFKDFWIEDNSNFAKGRNKSMYIVSNYCIYGDLKNYLNLLKEKNFEFSKNFYWDIIFEMIISVYFLHKLGYVHFDIKPSNFLVNENGQLLLSDFCLSIKEKDIITNCTDELEGDSIYISPELFYKNKESLISNKSDIFSLGLSIFEILTNFELPKNGDLWQLIRKKGIPNELLQKIPIFENDKSIFEKIIVDFTKYRSEDRPFLENVLKDEKNYFELYKRYMLLIDNNYKPKFNPKNIGDFKMETIDYSENFLKRFIKRSGSMDNNE